MTHIQEQDQQPKSPKADNVQQDETLKDSAQQNSTQSGRPQQDSAQTGSPQQDSTPEGRPQQDGTQRDRPQPHSPGWLHLHTPEVLVPLTHGTIPDNLLFLLKWVIVSIVTGLLLGGIGAGFSALLQGAAAFRASHGMIVALLPAGGLLLVFLYRLCRVYEDTGTNQIIGSITSTEEVPLRKAPLIVIGTAITHLFGGSAGREGAALQIGGCIGQNMARAFRFNDSDRRILTMCGMSAAFAALFGTPLTAAFFAMEMSSVGVLYYAALVPCALSALTANHFTTWLGVEKDAFFLHATPAFTVYHAVIAGCLTILCALLSMLFCVMMHKTSSAFRRIVNPYLRIAAGGAMVALLTFASGTTIYNGPGMGVIEDALRGNIPLFAFLLKMIFTSLTMGSGYKGGEIVPALYVGASFGASFARIGGFDPGLCAAIGMAALFCGITNCPISSLLLCFELFGYAGMPYYLLAIALSYTFSGYYSVYGSQTIVYSKQENRYVNRHVK